MAAPPNPFPKLQSDLRDALAVHLLPTEATQLLVISALLGAMLVMQLVAVVMRWRKGSFWLFRWSERGYILPAGTNLFLVACLVFGAIVQPVRAP